MNRLTHYHHMILAAAALLLLPPPAAMSQEDEVQWLEGPATADLGDNLAVVDVGEGYAFADGDDTRRIMQYMGNPPTNSEIGMIVPTDDEGDWFVVFEYEGVGYIKDDEQDDIDPDALLESIRQGTEVGNKERAKMGFAPLNILGWYEEPHYDPASHNLVWAILGEAEGDSVVNYNTRILGREGYVSTVLVSSPARLDAIRPELASIMSTFGYTDGKRYDQFVEGDKIAKYGLTALIAGGAGAVAAKTGLLAVVGKLFAKMGKLVIVIFAGIAAFFKKIVAAIRGKSRPSHAGPVRPRA